MCSVSPKTTRRRDEMKQTYALTHMKDTKNTRVFQADFKLEGRDVAFIVYVPKEFKVEGDKMAVTLDDGKPGT